MRFHIDGTQPTEEDTVFVFGSNLAGVHGAGAARAALKFGAVMGAGIGLFGNTYAIPTKDKKIRTLSLPQIKVFVKEFVAFTKENPYKDFFVTRIGCVLAGYQDRDIAPLFKGCGPNCSFAKEWEIYLK